MPREQLAAIDRYLQNHESLNEIETYDSLGVLCDLFHANSIEWIDRDVPGVCHRGDLLLSVRQLNLIAVLDLERMAVTWDWGADLLWRQHHASLLPGGHVLLFDNRKLRQGSRVIEVDPRSKEIIWDYWPKTPREFFSRLRGGCQRLTNGNTLITLSDKGRVLPLAGATGPSNE